MSAGDFNRPGQRVRVFFGPEHRDGTIEYVEQGRGAPRYHVRLSPGWVHLADAGDFICIPASVAGYVAKYDAKAAA